MTPDKLETAQSLMQDRSLSNAYNCRTVGVSRNPLYRYLTTLVELR